MKLAVTLLGLLVACGGGENTPPDAPVILIDAPPGDAPPPRETLTFMQPLDPGGDIAEAEMVGGMPGAGDRAIIRLSASTPFDYNIHAHPGGQTVNIHEELDVLEATFDFIPAEQAEYYLLLRSNASQITIDVEVDLYGTMTFVFI
jgi:hypothetical protein